MAMWKKKEAEVERQPHEYFAPINYAAAGADKTVEQANLITVRQSPAYTFTMALGAEALTRRADTILLDYTRDAVAVRFSIDGLWIQSQPRDRQTGDAMLACFKKLADLNVAERRAKQEGKFGAEFKGNKYNIIFTSQGVPTGERVVIKFVPKKAQFTKLEDLGMRDKMIEQFKQMINADQGMIVLSAPPANGLSTLWNVGLNAADRFMRDFVSAEDKRSTDDEVINITPNRFDAAAGETPDKILPAMLLKQPDVLVIPEMMNPATVEIACRHVNSTEKMVITRTVAKEAVEALVRLVMLKGPAAELAKAVTMVVNTRLVRKLCDCKQAYQPPPQLLQKLGIPPGRVQMLYREYQPPPPDPNAKKVEEPQICSKCGGGGYFGRTGIFEMLIVNDQMRQAMVKNPKVEVLREIAKQSGTRSIQEEGILLLVKGVTSLPELQRVLKA